MTTTERIELMRASIAARYGSTIRGRRIADMSESQVIAIYFRMLEAGENMDKREEPRCEQLSFL